MGEKLDAHRKARQAAYPDLTLTGMYNVLEKLRAGDPLAVKEKQIHDQGLVTILQQIHEELDEAVLLAYGWENLMTLWAGAYHPMGTPECREAFEQELLKRLVALNHERAEEEKRGLVRWLRPEYQAPEEAGVPRAEQKQIELEAETASTKPVAPVEKLKWPASLAEQVAAIQRILPATGPDPSELAACFGKRIKARVRAIGEILETLAALGKA